MHKVESFLQELSSVLQVVRIYTFQHPKSQEAVEKAFACLNAMLVEFGQATIGIVGDEFVFGNEVFFDLSVRQRELIVEFLSRGIEKMIFVRPVAKSAFEDFIESLIMKKDSFGEDFQGYFEKLGIENIYVGKITVSVKAVHDDEVQKEAPTMKYDDMLAAVQSSFNDVIERRFTDPASTKAAVKNALMMALEGRWEFLALSSVKRYDLNTFVHCLNVAVLVMFFATKIGFKREEVYALGVAALFHDMGKIAISRKVVQKPGKLTDTEFSKIKSHSILGGEILLNYIDSLGILPAIVAYEHHLRYDLKGYPKLTYSHKPNIASLIVALCDCYDALRQKRSYKDDYPPELIYEIMSKDKGTMFEPFLFDKFFRAFGIYPVGTIVELTDKRVGIVREQNGSHIDSPRIEILSPQEKPGTLLDIASQDTVRIVRSLARPGGEAGTVSAA